MGRGYVRPTRVNKYQSSKVNPTEAEETCISFNLKRLKESPEQFCYSKDDECKKQYFLKLLERLRDLSCQTRAWLMQNGSHPSLRFHPLRFDEGGMSVNSFGLGVECDEDAWQFTISQNEHGRVHGYFIGNVFYLVWLDRKHELYSKK